MLAETPGPAILIIWQDIICWKTGSNHNQNQVVPRPCVITRAEGVTGPLSTTAESLLSTLKKGIEGDTDW